jgi:hypothetical protein
VNPGYLVVALIAILLVISWRRRRHGEASVPAARWQRTDEVFKDPSTDRIMRVYVDPADGSRHHVPESRPVGGPPEERPGPGDNGSR